MRCDAARVRATLRNERFVCTVGFSRAQWRTAARPRGGAGCAVMAAVVLEAREQTRMESAARNRLAATGTGRRTRDDLPGLHARDPRTRAVPLGGAGRQEGSVPRDFRGMARPAGRGRILP